MKMIEEKFDKMMIINIIKNAKIFDDINLMTLF